MAAPRTAVRWSTVVTAHGWDAFPTSPVLFEVVTEVG